MRILFLTQYYPPETGAAQNRLSDLARRLTNAGHHITVLTAMPSYPKGEIYPGYEGRMGLEENDAGIQIVRTWIYATKRKNFVPRILNYLSFAVLSTVVGWRTIDKADVVFVESPPLFAGFAGYLLSKLKHARFVLNISDLWPESAVVLGVLRNQRVIKWVTQAEEWLYHKATLVTGQTQGIVDSIRKRCANTPVHLLTNGVAPEFVEQVQHLRSSRMQLREKFGFGQKFIVAYTGVHGLAQGLDTMLSSAALLKEHKDIQFCFFGDGPEKPHLQLFAAELGLENVQFFSPLPIFQMVEVLTAIDAAVVPLKRIDLFNGALPSKLFEAMGAAVPVIGAFQGEAQKLIEDANCGLCVEPENAAAMKTAILTMFGDPTLRKRLGDNGCAYVLTHYNRKDIAACFESLLLDSLSTSTRLNGKVRANHSSAELLDQSANLRPTVQSKVDE
jgi:glycosyltransferase involved in cell wall biosynthesis